MLQRYIYDALVAGCGAYQQNPQLFAQLFGAPNGWCLSDAEVAEITTYFQQQPVQVRQGYGRRAITDGPTLVIILESESQSEMFLGDFGGAANTPQLVSQPGGNVSALVPVSAAMWTHSYQILCLAQPKPQNTLYLYELAKACILAAKNDLAQYGVRQVTLGGSDLSFDARKAPNTEYMRTLTVQCKRTFAVSDASSALAQAFDVEGLSMTTPSNNTDGNPLALVTTFDPDADLSTP